jgi:hypothetical protein
MGGSPSKTHRRPALKIRGMIDAMLHVLSKDPGEKPPKKAKRK